MATNSPTNTRILPTGQVSVSDIRLLDSGNWGTVEVPITDVEKDWMGTDGAVPPRAVSNWTSGPKFALCMPGQQQKVSAENWTYSPPAGFTTSNAWKSTSMSEFRNAYKDRPTASIAALGTGENAGGGFYNGAMRCTGSNPNGNIPNYSFWIELTSGTGSIRSGGPGWYVANISSGTQRDIYITSSTTSNSHWRCYVRDGNNCGQNFEFFSAAVKYP